MMFVLPTLEWWTIAPVVVLTLTGCLVLVVDLFRGDDASPEPLAWLTTGGLAIAIGTSVSLWGYESQAAFSGMVVADNYTQYFTVLFLVIVGVTVLLSFDQLTREDFHPGEFYSLIVFSAVGMVLMASAADLIMVFVGLELLSICLYILTGFSRRRLESEEASIKYLLLGAFASGFLLYGIALVYGSTGSTNLGCVARAINPASTFAMFGCGTGSVAGAATSALLLAGVAMLVVGLGFKAAVVPFHMWTPDVYEGAPTAITAYMSVGAKAAAFAAIARVFMIAFPTLSHDWSVILAILAAVTMIVGNTAAVSQQSIKRMLAYSSIAHAGYILVAVVAASRVGMASLLFYTVGYTVMNLGAFMVVILLGKRSEDHLLISDYAGLSRRHPVLAGLMALFMLSLAGIPPTVGFVGKFYIFTAAVQADYAWLAVIGLLSSVISVYYYLRVVYQMYMVDPVAGVEAVTPLRWVTVAAGVAGVAVIALGVFPQGVLALASASSTFIR
ncbi:MAG: NADH-quinone oxidoreductase chain [Chloroflexota bacterium]|jgi:NADH-quinone oxidoreductase subunit N